MDADTYFNQLIDAEENAKMEFHDDMINVMELVCIYGNLFQHELEELLYFQDNLQWKDEYWEDYGVSV